MRDRLIHALIQGDRLAWGAAGALWVLTAIIVLLHRPSPRAAGSFGAPRDRGTAWTWLLLVVATGTSLAGLPLSAAIAMPRLRWATVDAPDLVIPSGETWRRLRGPAVTVPGPDIAVPTIDTEGRWMLYGLLSGKPVPGLPAAEPAALRPGVPRLCQIDGDQCRPWPVAWPDPARPPGLAELSWSRPGARDAGDQALAYDTETGLYLRRIDPASGLLVAHDRLLDGPHLELVGRVTPDVTREGPGVLFVLREVERGRLRAMRLAVMPKGAEGGGAAGPAGGVHVFRMQRAEASLTAGPRVYQYAVRPVLVLTSLSLPLAVLALLVAPRLRRANDGAPRPSRREAAAWIGPYLEAAAVLAAGVAAAAPAVVALVSLWGSR